MLMNKRNFLIFFPSNKKLSSVLILIVTLLIYNNYNLPKKRIRPNNVYILLDEINGPNEFGDILITNN